MEQKESPQLKISYDTNKALSLGLDLKNIDSTLSAAWGGTYVNDYIDKTRIKRVYIQADAPFRSSPEDLYKWKVRNSSGLMVPFSEFSSLSWVYAPEERQHDLMDLSLMKFKEVQHLELALVLL